MTDISKNWFDLSVNSNILKKTYINGFIDVCNNIVGRENVWIKNEVNAGDTRLGLGTVDPSFMIDIISNNPKIRFTNSSITVGTRNDTNLGTINMVSPSNNDITSSIICQNIDEDEDVDGSLIFSTGGGNLANAEDSMVINKDIVTFGTSINKGFTGYTNTDSKCRVYGDVTCNEMFGFGCTPLGGIIMWSGSLTSNSPIINSVFYGNWKKCDGGTYNGITTPDLRNRFIVGAGSSYSIGNTGGADSVTLQTKHLPPHTHSVNSGGGHTHSVRVGAIQHGWDSSVTTVGTDDHGAVSNSRDYSDYNNFTHTHTIYNTGGGKSHENRPPYYALVFIMRVQ
jgi:microcystin-dependent protein